MCVIDQVLYLKPDKHLRNAQLNPRISKSPKIGCHSTNPRNRIGEFEPEELAVAVELSTEPKRERGER